MVDRIVSPETWQHRLEAVKAVQLLHGFHALRLPWLHTAEVWFDEMAARAAMLPEARNMPTWERHFIDPQIPSRQIARLLIPIYRPVSNYIRGEEVIRGAEVRTFMHQMARESQMHETHPLVNGLGLDDLLPDNATFESMHYNGTRKICHPLVDFIDLQRRQAEHDQTQQAA